MDEFYKHMPFNTDFDHYKQHVAGLNVAYINHFEHYHTMLDNPDNVSLASLQHHGNYVLGLARHFGDMPLGDCYAPDAVYFNTLGNHMAVYPISWGWTLAVLAWSLALAVLALGGISRRLAVGGSLLGFGSIPLAALASSPLIGLISYALYQHFNEAVLYQNNVYALGFHLGAMGALLLSMGLLYRWVKPQEFLAGAVMWWALALVVLQWWAPGGAHLAMIPLLCGSLGLFVLLVLPAIMVQVPLLVIASQALTFLAGFLLVPNALLAGGLIMPQVSQFSRAGLFQAAGTLVLAGVILLIAGVVGTLPSPSSPRIHCLAYGVDFDREEAWWLSADDRVDEWTSSVIPEGTQRRRLPDFVGQDQHDYLVASAPLPREGADLRLEVEPGVPLVFSVREVSYGLPDLPEVKPRPAHLIPEPNRRLDGHGFLHSDFTYSTATLFALRTTEQSPTLIVLPVQANARFTHWSHCLQSLSRAFLSSRKCL
jgi:hypothetical protein